MLPRTPVSFALVLFVTLSLAIAAAELMHHEQMIFCCKIFSVPSLALYFALCVNGLWSAERSLRMVAFFFSWLGDISLLLVPKHAHDTHIFFLAKNKYFFLMGLSAFLVAQVFFIFTYRKATDASMNSRLPYYYYIPFGIYLVAMLSIVLPPLANNPDKSQAVVPVIFYASTLIGMAATAAWRFGKTNPHSYWITLAGGCIFVISDSLIALNFLARPVPSYYAGFAISTTYLLAEYLISEGVLRHRSAQQGIAH